MPSFPKESRLRTPGQFNEVNRRGKKVQGKYLLISYLEGHEGPPRLGITVTKKYGKAYKRNRFKRVVREAFRLSQSELPAHVQLNVRPLHHPNSEQSPSLTLHHILEDFHLLSAIGSCTMLSCSKVGGRNLNAEERRDRQEVALPQTCS